MTRIARSLINGDANGHVDANDRGLCYGDGLFETLLFLQGAAPLWPRHMARLVEGCARLALPAPDLELLARETAEVSAGLPRAIVRIIWTRGPAPRGYAAPERLQPLRIVAASPAPDIPPDWYENGIRMRECALRLSEQPRLAGIKHLNRLEQVLARAEWQGHAIAEGLLCDAQGRVVSATAANIFAVIDKSLLTPALEHCGVAGVARAEILAQHIDCTVGEMTMPQLLRADEVFVTSSVRGVVPVTALGERQWPVGDVARALMQQWRRRGLIV